MTCMGEEVRSQENSGDCLRPDRQKDSPDPELEDRLTPVGEADERISVVVSFRIFPVIF